MELVNALQAFDAASGDGATAAADRAALIREAVETTLLLLGPFCPHVTEELWSQLGHRESLFKQRWPVADPAALQKTEVTVVVQVDGKVVGYSVQSIAFDNQANVRQYRLVVTMNLRLRDVKKSSILFEEQSLREKADFQVLGAVSQTISGEEAAVRTAASEIARSIVSLTIDRF